MNDEEAQAQLEERQQWEELRQQAFIGIGAYYSTFGLQATLDLLTTAIHTCYQLEARKRDNEATPEESPIIQD